MMDWAAVLQTKPRDVEKEEALLEDLYAFFCHEELPQSVEGAPPELQDSRPLLKAMDVLCTVMRMKGLEVQAAEEEVRELQEQCDSMAARASNNSSNEQDLVEQVLQLEKDVRFKEDVIERLKHQVVRPASPSIMTEIRHLREELEDVRTERDELRQSIGHERDENKRLMAAASGEKLKFRQIERELDQVQYSLEDNHKQLNWQREQGYGVRGRGTVEADYRERMKKKDIELGKQLDKIEELLGCRDDMEQQVRDLTLQLSQMEEQKLTALKDMQARKTALVDSDGRCDELVRQNLLLEGKIKDLREQLTDQAGANEHIINLMKNKAQEWEGVLVVKGDELAEYRKKVQQLEVHLRTAQQHESHITLVTLKKELQNRGAELEAVQKELSEATQHISDLTTELEQARLQDSSELGKLAQKQKWKEAEAKVVMLEKYLTMEVCRREEVEAEKEDRDGDLTRALGMLGKYERGDYGLHEAVMEIKMKKKELAVRDKDIAELTRHLNQLENRLNRLSEENEVLRGRLGLSEDENVDVSEVRGRREVRFHQLLRDNRMLEKEVERLVEEKLSLRKQLLEHGLVRTTPKHVHSRSHDTPSHQQHDSTHALMGAEEAVRTTPKQVHSRSHDTPSHQQHDSTHALLGAEEALKSKVMALEKACEEERCNREVWQGQAEVEKEHLNQTRMKLRSMETLLTEMQWNTKPHTDREKKQQPLMSELLEKLIAMFELDISPAASDKGIALTLQLKYKLSEITGQKEMLVQQLHQVELEARSALRELERKQCQVETLTRDVAILRKQRSAFKPILLSEGLPLSSSEVITGLNEQLLHALQQLHDREEVLMEVRGEMEGLQRKFAVVMHQLGILYQEYTEGFSQWESHKKASEADKERLLAEKEHDRIKVQELESLQSSLAGGEEDMGRKLGEMSRRLTLLQVKEQTTHRREELLQVREASLRKENATLCRDKVQMEKAITERMSYLQRHKETSLYKLRSVQQELSESVPCAELDKANQLYHQLAGKYQKLLHQQSAYTATTATVEQLQLMVQTLGHQLEEVKSELSQEKTKSWLLERAGGGDVGSEGLRTSGGTDHAATLEMKALNAIQRAELASVRCQQLQKVVVQLEQRNATLETNFSELTEHLLQAQLNESELRDQLARSLPQAQRTELEEKIAELSKSEAQLTISNSQLKEVAEVARHQAIAVEMMQNSRDLEVASLRHQLLDLQGSSEERTAIGRLHHQLLGLQVNEAMAVKKLEVAEAKMCRLEASLLRSEQERVRENEAVFKVRAMANSKVKHLRATIQALRQKYSLAIPLSKQENFALLIQQAQEDRKVTHRLHEEARQDRDQAKDKLLELKIKQMNLEELIMSLRESTSTNQTASARLTEWHSKLGELRLVELRVTRTNQQLRDRVEQLESLVRSSEETFTKLEEQLVAVTKDYEESQLSWELREAQLEKQLDAFTTAQPSTFCTSVKPLDSPQHLQEALVRLQECSHEKNLLTQRAQEREKDVRRLENALKQVRKEMAEKEEVRTSLRREMEKMKKANQVAATDGEEDRGALQLAQSTIRQLKIQLSEKEELAEKYLTMLQDARKELQREVTTHKQEIASLRAKVNSQAEESFSKLKTEALEAARTPTPILPSDSQLERLLVLEELTSSQEEEIKKYRQQLESEGREGRARERTYEATVRKLQNEVKDLGRQSRLEVEELRASLSESKLHGTELEQEVEVLEGELSAAQGAAKKAPSRTLRALVERLRNQLVIKEKQQRVFSEALLQVRADLVETAQRTLEGESARESQEESVRQLVLQRTHQLQEQVEELGVVRVELSASESREKARMEEVRRMSEKLEENEEEMRAAKRQLQEQEELLTRAKTSQQQSAKEPSLLLLQRKVRTLQSKLETQKTKIRKQEEELKARSESHDQQQQQALEKGPVAKDPTQVVAAGRLPIDSKHQATEVLRWEEGKKWQKKLSGAREKLTETERELETAQKQISGLKELQSRNDREKGALQSKLKALRKQLGQSPTLQGKVEESNDVRGHTVEELERVITAMRKVIEKLQGDNEKLRRKKTAYESKAEGKITAIVGSGFLEENRKLKAELLELRAGMGVASSDHTAKHPYKKTSSDCEQLKKELQKEVSRAEGLQQSLSTLRQQNHKLTQELEKVKFNQTQSLAPSMHGTDGGGKREGELLVRVEELQAEVEKKSLMLMDVKRHLREASERDRSATPTDSQKSLAVVNKDGQKQEIARLRKELDAFDPAFFEEIEDLKFNYQEAVKKNVLLEAKLIQLAEEHEINMSSLSQELHQ